MSDQTRTINTKFTRTVKTSVDGELTRLQAFAQLLVDQTETMWGDDMLQLGNTSLVNFRNQETQQFDLIARELLNGLSQLSQHVGNELWKADCEVQQ